MIVHPNYTGNSKLIAILKDLNNNGFNCILDNPSNRASLGRFIFDEEYDKEKVFKIMSKHMKSENIKFDLNE